MTRPSVRPHRIVWLGDPKREVDEEPIVEFRLTYEGRLASGASATPEHKHDIRRVFHRQLKQFWYSHPFLSKDSPWRDTTCRRLIGDPYPQHIQTRTDELAAVHTRSGFHFVPLVLQELMLHCDLNILFLRPGAPGDVVKSGDLDNRLKTLFDALSVPQALRGEPADDEKPMFVLVADDRLITRLVVETDQLLQPTSADAGPQDARLVIAVRLTPYVPMWSTVGF